MSKMLQVLLEDDQMASLITENEEPILEGSEMLMEFMDVIHEEAMSNPEKFLVPGDIKATAEGIKIFTEAAVASFLDQVSDDIVAD